MSTPQLYQRRFFRLKNEIRFYIGLLVLQFLSVGILYFLAYVDNLNMINNGYVGKQSITFKIAKADTPLQLPDQDYLLMQYNSIRPSVKTVYLNGDVKLPPLKNQNKIIDELQSRALTSNLAIIGKQVDPQEVPTGYVLSGQFDVPKHYQLSNDQWLLPSSNELSLADGDMFVLSAPNSKVEGLVRTLANNNSVEIIHTEYKGTYALLSNQLLILLFWGGLIFASFVVLVASLYWLKQERAFIRICYEHGFALWKVYSHIFLYKLTPYLMVSFFTLLVWTSMLQKFVPVWSRHWQIESWYLIGTFNLVLILLTFFTSIWYGSGQRRKY